MASETDHIRLANRNHDILLQLVDGGAFLDWAVTVAFYKALHVVEAVFCNDLGVHSTSHAEREKTLKIARYRSIFRNHGHLLTASRVARYLEASGPGRFRTFSDYMDDAAARKLIRERLYGVEQNAIPFLSAQAVSDLKKIDPAKL